MIDNIIGFSIRNKLLIGMFVLALTIWGLYSAVRIPLDAVPDITNNQVQVITQAPSLAAQEVEQFITFPLENSLRNMPGVVEIRSISRFGLSVITVVFEESTDTYLARQLTAEQLKLAEGDILQGAGTPAMAPITTGLGEIYQYVLRPKRGFESLYPPMELRSIQDWLVKRQLSGIEGVVEVSSFGGFVKQYEVSIVPERLQAMDISLHEVFDALTVNNANTGGSYIEKNRNAYFIRGEGMVQSLEDIEQIVIKNVRGIPVLIRHVAKVRFGHAPRFGAMTRNGEGEVVGGIVMMLKGASSEATIRGVKERVIQVQSSLPEGLVIEPYLDRTDLIDKAIRTVRNNLLEGGLIVVFVLVLLLGNLRAGLVVASVIPLSMLFALGMMNLFGVSANLMSLGAIDFGLIVDGAVIIVESIVHRLHLHYGNQQITQQQMNNSVYESATRIRKSAAFGEIIILIVYLPILALAGIEGKMFHPMALTVSFAILGALVLSLTYVPMASSLFLSKKVVLQTTTSDKIMAWLYKSYAPVIHWALARKKAVLATALALFAGSLLLFATLGGEFIPNLDEGDLAISVALKPGSSLSQTIATTTQIEKILKDNFPEVKSVISKIGTAEIPTDPMPIEAADIMIVLKDREEWTSTDDKNALVAMMEEKLSVLPGLNLEFTQPIQLRFNELMTGVKSDVAIKLYGENLDTLFQQANQTASVLRKIKGVGDLKVEQIEGLPQMLVSYNRSKIAQYGLNIAELNTLLKTAFAGEMAGVVFEGEKRFDLVVRLDTAARKGIEDLRNLYVDLPNGSRGGHMALASISHRIPLSEVAVISYQEAPMQISRDNARRRITIGINVRNRDVESVVDEARKTLEQQIKLPAGYYFTYGGQFENLVKARERLLIAVPLALGLIFVLLYFTFGSIKQSLLIFTAIPLSAIGGILALWLRDMPFSISAGVGFIALFGVAVLNGIVLIGYFNQLKSEGVTDTYQRIIEGTKVRFRPVIMTAAVASLGFLPMALSTTAGAEVQKPLATVVIGGLITATLLTLVVLPVLYSIFDKDQPGGSTPSKGLAPVIVLLLLLSGTFVTDAKAQSSRPGTVSKPITTLPQAIQTALEQNLSIQVSRLETEAQRKALGTAWDLPPTSLEVQYGQINALTNDYSYNLVQQLSFPTVYAAQHRLLHSQLLTAEKRQQLLQNEIIRNVALVYYHLLNLHHQEILLIKQDSLYSRAAHAAQVRYRTGETNLLEQVSAEVRAREIKNRLVNLQAQITARKISLAVLLHQQEIEIDTSLPLRKPLTIDLPNTLTGSPVLALLQQQIKTSQLQTRLEQHRLLPDFKAGYYNQSIEHVPGYQVVQAGIAVPLFFHSQRARIATAKVAEKVAEAQLQAQQTQLNGELQMLQQHYNRLNTSLAFYESHALQQAELIVANAEKSYRSGEIGYMEFIQNTQQAWQIQEAYLDQVREYNEVVILIEAIQGYKF